MSDPSYPEQPAYGGQPRQFGVGHPGFQQPGSGQPGYGQPGFGGPPGGGMSPPGWPPQQPRKRSKLPLVVGSIVLVTFVGLAIALLIGSQGDRPTAQPDVGTQSASDDVQPTKTSEASSPQPTEGGVDEGVEAGHGIFVQPAPGWSPEPPENNEVLLYTEDRADWLYLIVVEDPDFEGTAQLENLVERENKDYMSDFTSGKPEPRQTGNPSITYMESMSWSGTINSSKKGKVPVKGYTTLIHRKDGIVSWVRFMTRADRAAQLQQSRDAMLDSIVASQ